MQASVPCVLTSTTTNRDGNKQLKVGIESGECHLKNAVFYIFDTFSDIATRHSDVI